MRVDTNTAVDDCLLPQAMVYGDQEDERRRPGEQWRAVLE